MIWAAPGAFYFTIKERRSLSGTALFVCGVFPDGTPYRLLTSSTTFLIAAAASSGSLLKPPSSVSSLVT